MIHSKSVTAIVPIKERSQRVKDKNFRNFSGKALYHHILETLQRTHPIDNVIVDTDSLLVMNEAPKLFSKVKVVERPQELRGDHVSVNRIIEHDLSLSDSDIYVQTHATNPLLKAETIAMALTVFLKKEEEYDSLVSVNRYQSRFYLEDGKPVNHDPDDLIRTQDLAPVYEENSILYIFTKRSFAKSKRRIGENPFMYEAPRIESIDIDDEFSFRLAEILTLYRAEDME